MLFLSPLQLPGVIQVPQDNSLSLSLGTIHWRPLLRSAYLHSWGGEFEAVKLSFSGRYISLMATGTLDRASPRCRPGGSFDEVDCAMV